MAQLQDLQAIIDKRATDRLNKDINQLVRSIQLNPLLDKIQVFLPKKTAPQRNEPVQYEPHSFKNVLYYDYMLGKEIFDTNIEKYRAEEASNFIKRVDEIKDQVDNLYEITSNLENR